ncbi:MAG: hypothetical protein HFG00_04590 [Oscillibacter sp.]|nr:hypothetical protein [Oscillibacter sp.]
MYIFPAFAAYLDFLGGYSGIFGPYAVSAGVLGAGWIEKIAALGKKSLLFLEKMLYNKSQRARSREGGRQTWQGQQKEERSFAQGF